ncbi:MAG: glycosyltransferase family 39 protein [Deltaproteobacteria bacterium]|nr:glycosyltransferase family 39 protein [Deltaproteobacteria bacterium]
MIPLHRREWNRESWLFFMVVVPALLVLMALAAPVNHDEDQYLGAAALVRDAAIYRDFMSLQTPLHAYVFAPLTLLTGWSFLAMRVATALLAAATLALVYAAQRLLGVGRRTAMLATALLLCCTAFQVGASVVRNDILPALLLALAIVAALRALDGAAWSAPLAAGLCVGLAIAAKISYAPFAPALCLALLLPAHPAQPIFGRRIVMSTVAGIGVLAGMLPAVLCFARAPEAFWWGVVAFARSAPHAYYGASGQAPWLTPWGKLLRLLLVAAEGPALPALVVWLVASRRAHDGAARRARSLLGLFVLAGLVAAFLPAAGWRQYLLPALPPLFILLGTILTEPDDRRRAWGTLLVLFALAGLARPARDAAVALAEGSPVLRTERSAHRIGATLRAAGISGRLATVSVHAVVDSGHEFDHRFATGVFVARSRGLLSIEAADAFHVLTADGVARAFDRAPPGAILTGHEQPSDTFPLRQDATLRDYALAHAYVLHPVAGDDGELWLAPGSEALVRTQ